MLGPSGKNMAVTGNALLADRANDRIWIVNLGHKMSVHGNRGFVSTGAMTTHRDILWHDLGSVVLGLDVSVSIHRGVAFEDVVARFVEVERVHPTHEDGGNNSVLQSIMCHRFVPHLLRLCINDRCGEGAVSGSDGGVGGGGLIRDTT